MVTKKRSNVKRTRSLAAKRGWVTRRRNEKLNIDPSVAKRLKAELRKQSELRQQAEDKALEAEQKYREALKKLAAKERQGREIITGTAKEMIALLPKKEQPAARKDYIQHKMDQALRVYGEVTFEAVELADELDIDIGDVFDDWDYDSESAA